MSDERKPFWPWFVALLIGLPILYQLSLGPWVWILQHHVLPAPVELLLARMTPTYAAPSNFVHDHAPSPVQAVMEWYMDLWISPP
jgi:hypothetical protein